MATKDMAYDNPAYLMVGAASLGTVGAGSGANSQRWCAPYAVTIKSLTYTTVTQGTGAATDAKTLYLISQGTATTTIALFTTTAAIYSTYVGTGTLVTNRTMAKGDVAYLGKGTDATEVGAVSLEYILQQQASVTQ